MNYFWGNVFEYVKERRNAAVFFGSLAMVIALVLVGAIFPNLLQAWPTILSGGGIGLMVLIWHEIRLAQIRRLNRNNNSPLSRDEILKARSKLVKQR